MADEADPSVAAGKKRKRGATGGKMASAITEHSNKRRKTQDKGSGEIVVKAAVLELETTSVKRPEPKDQVENPNAEEAATLAGKSRRAERRVAKEERRKRREADGRGSDNRLPSQAVDQRAHECRLVANVGERRTKDADEVSPAQLLTMGIDATQDKIGKDVTATKLDVQPTSVSKAERKKQRQMLALSAQHTATSIPEPKPTPRTTPVAAPAAPAPAPAPSPILPTDAETEKERNARRDEHRKAWSAVLPANKAEVATSDASKHVAGEAGNIQVVKRKQRAERSSPKQLAESEQPLEIKKRAYIVSPASPGRFTDHDPIFAEHNGQQYIITAKVKEIQILSVETSLLVRSIPVVAGSTVASFALSPADPEYLYIAYSNGYMQIYDWTTAKLYRELPRLQGTPRCIAITAAAENHDMRMAVCQAKGGNIIYANKQELYNAKDQLGGLQVLGEQGRFILTTASNRLILGRKNNPAEQKLTYTWLEIPVSRAIMCADLRLATSAATGNKTGEEALSLVIGNDEGQLHLYSDLLPLLQPSKHSASNPQLPAPRILHWHREAVSTVKFSKDGNYLISGGKETVLVLWQLETGKKQFLPHLTSEIERVVVSPAGDRYAVQMGDNSIMVLSTSELKPIANFAGLQLAEARDTQSRSKVPVVLHPIQPSQILLAVPASRPRSPYDIGSRPFLQTFDTQTSRHVLRQALTRNNVTDFNLGPERTPIAPPDVLHIAISHDGCWLGTVDEWMPPARDVAYLAADEDAVHEERVKRSEVHLKIWRWDEVQTLWTLNTRFDAPHPRANGEAQGAGRIFSLVAHPGAAAFATVGEDGTVKVWRPKKRTRHGVVVQDGNAKTLVDWNCRHTVELEKKAERMDSPLEHSSATVLKHACLAYSDDGSLLAAAQDFDGSKSVPTVRFIDTTEHSLHSQHAGLCGPGLVDIALLDRYFIALAASQVSVWDIVTNEHKHTVTLPPGRAVSVLPVLAVNSTEKTFVIASAMLAESATMVDVYSPIKETPLHREELDTPVAAVLVAKGSKGYKILCSDATVSTISPRGSPATLPLPATESGQDSLAVEETNTAVDSEPATNLLDLPISNKDQGQSLTLEDVENDRPVVRPEQLARIFDIGHSFALPPVRDMFEAVVGLFGRPPRADARAVVSEA